MLFISVLVGSEEKDNINQDHVYVLHTYIHYPKGLLIIKVIVRKF